MTRLAQALAALLLLCGPAAAQSTINPSAPAQNSPLSSAPVRGNFAAAYADVNGLLGMHASATVDACPLPALVGTECLVTGSVPYVWYRYSGTGEGYVEIGTLNPSTGLFVVSGGSLGLVATPPLVMSYPSGVATIALDHDASLALSGGNLGVNPAHGNVFTAPQAINASGGALPTPQAGTILQLSNAPGSVSRLEQDAFAAAGHFTAMRGDNAPAAPSTLAAGDEIGSFNVGGYDGAAWVAPRGGLRCYAAPAGTAWTISDQGTYCDVAATAPGATAPTQVARFNGDGGMLVPGTVTGGDEGAGTINAVGLYVGGVAVASGASSPLVLSAGALSCSTCVVGVGGAIAANATTTDGFSTGQVLYSDGTKVQAAGVTGTLGDVVLSVGPTITGSFTATGLVTNADLAYDYVYVNGVQCSLGVASPGCSVTATAASMMVGSTTVLSGTDGYFLYQNGASPSGTVGEVAATGTGDVVLATLPSIAGMNVSGTANFTGTLEVGGTAETFPASGLIVGTTDSQTLTNKSIAGSEIDSGTVPAARLPLATSSVPGAVQGDGSTLTISSGVISCTTATSSQVGCAEPDNVTIVVSGGVLTAIRASASGIDAGGATAISNGKVNDYLYDQTGSVGHSGFPYAAMASTVGAL